MFAVMLCALSTWGGGLLSYFGVNKVFSGVHIFLGAFEKLAKALGVVVYAYNPSYQGGRDWKDRGLRPAQANS
jgi:hypothetical protein